MAHPFIRYSYTSFLLLVFFSCALSDSPQNVTVEDICTKHRNRSFCLAVLNTVENGTGSGLDLLRLGQSVVNLARVNATNTRSLIQSLLNETIDPELKKCYTECSESYDDALEDLEGVKQQLVSGDYNGANVAASAAMTNVDDCKSSFHGQSKLTKNSTELEDISIIVMIIANFLAMH